MILAEKVSVQGKDWIKVRIPDIPEVSCNMRRVNGARYNEVTKNWSVPYENRIDFEVKMSDHLIIWDNDPKDTGSGGIPEEKISSYPIIPGYSVEYGGGGTIKKASGWKTPPWGEFQVKGFNLLLSRDFLILADDAGLGI